DTVKALLEVMGDRIMSRSEIMQELGLKHKTHFLESYLNPAIQLGLIEPTKKPNHPRQKYRQKKSKI
ncbi:Fic family protein, partial [Bacteroides acidifaciens]